LIVEKPILKGIENHKYRIQIASDESQVEEALKLRYRVFGEELNRKFSFNGQKDRDEFDDQSHHLLVIERQSEAIIGTYRLQRYEQAKEGNGFASSKRFVLDVLPDDLLRLSFEVGRVCIEPAHRNGRVLYLLWKGLAAYLRYYNLRYLFGYSALEESGVEIALATWHYLRENNFMDQNYHVEVRDEYKIDTSNSAISSEEVTLPPLLKNYLDVGTRVCSEPAYDPIMKISHFFILFDVEAITPRTRKMFFG